MSFAENLISLVFDEDIIVTVFGSLAFRLNAQSEDRFESPPVSSSRLVSLVGQAVVSTVVTSPKELMLRLQNGGSIRFVDDSEDYESFTIRTGDKEVVI